MIFIVLGIIKIKLDIFCEVGEFCMLYVCHLQHVQSSMFITACKYTMCFSIYSLFWSCDRGHR